MNLSRQQSSSLSSPASSGVDRLDGLLLNSNPVVSPASGTGQMSVPIESVTGILGSSDVVVANSLLDTHGSEMPSKRRRRESSVYKGGKCISILSLQ
jgi:hypothetical protein